MKPHIKDANEIVNEYPEICSNQDKLSDDCIKDIIRYIIEDSKIVTKEKYLYQEFIKNELLIFMNKPEEHNQFFPYFITNLILYKGDKNQILREIAISIIEKYKTFDFERNKL